jgi:hypothetical protein
MVTSPVLLESFQWRLFRQTKPAQALMFTMEHHLDLLGGVASYNDSIVQAI